MILFCFQKQEFVIGNFSHLINIDKMIFNCFSLNTGRIVSASCDEFDYPLVKIVIINSELSILSIYNEITYFPFNIA